MPPAILCPHGSAREREREKQPLEPHIFLSQGWGFFSPFIFEVSWHLDRGLSSERAIQWCVEQCVHLKGMLPDTSPCVKAANSDP